MKIIPIVTSNGTAACSLESPNSEDSCSALPKTLQA